MHKTLDEACVLGTEFVPFYENNFSALHDKICGVLWSINSATLLIHVAAGLCSKGFLDALFDELESERESLTDLNKYQKDIYNDVVKMSEKHCNENVVDLRCVLLLNIMMHLWRQPMKNDLRLTTKLPAQYRRPNLMWATRSYVSS